MPNEFGTTAEYVAVFRALQSQGIHPNHRALLEAHLQAPAATASWRQLARAAGYKDEDPVKLQYGTFAGRVARRLGVRRRPEGFWLYVLAEWAEERDDKGHTRYRLRPEVVAALKRLGWALGGAGRGNAPNGRLHIVQGGVANGDKSWLERVKRGTRSRSWIAPKTAAIGDDVIIYIRGYGLFASAKVDSEALLRRDWKGRRYGVALKHIRMIAPPIPLEVVRRETPTFEWARYPRSIVTPDRAISNKVRRLVSRGRNGGHTRGRARKQFALDRLRAAALLQAKERVEATSVSTKRRERAPDVHQYALARANGHCEGCSARAPFRKRDGAPYLEPHHLTRLSDDGADAPENVIALCPTCHRRVHHAQDGRQYNDLLKRKLRQIENT